MVRSRQANTGGAKYTGLFVIGLFIFALIPIARITAQGAAPASQPVDRQGTPGSEPDIYKQASLALTGETHPSLLSSSNTAVASIKAVVLRSFGGCDGTNMAWDTLNNSWSDYGSIPLSVVYDDPELCSGNPITYEDLVASGADVVVLSWTGQFTSDEITAIKNFAEDGHNLFATSSTFDNYNQDLMPVFGLQSGLAYTSTQLFHSYEMGNVNDPLFEDMSNPFTSLGYYDSYAPAIGPGGTPEWSSVALDGARFMARSLVFDEAITFFVGKGYHAIYVSNAVEYALGYGPDTQDLQFLYNALTYPAVRKAVVVRSKGCYGSTGFLDLDNNWPDYGPIPIFIEFSHDALCSEMTYDGLAASGADVVILSYAIAPAFTNDELAALGQYAGEGHDLIATYLSLGDPVTLPYDNRALGSLFGLNDTLGYWYYPVTPVITQVISSPLFIDLPSTFSSSSLTWSQTPADDYTWDESDLDGAVYAAKSADDKTMVSLYSAPNYSAFYISSYPEFNFQTPGIQLLYNAITYGYDDNVYLFLPTIIKNN